MTLSAEELVIPTGLVYVTFEYPTNLIISLLTQPKGSFVNVWGIEIKLSQP